MNRTLNRTLSATLRYYRADLKWAVFITALLGLLCEALGIFVAVMGEPEATSLLVLGILLGGSVLVDLLFAVQYLLNNYSLLLSFSSTRRGLTAGLALHCLTFTALQVGTAFVWGTVTALVHGAVLGLPPDLPWQCIPWPVWPALLVVPTLLGLFFGGMVQRFGRRAGWVLYFLFLGVCGTTSSWLPVLAHRVPSVSYPALGLGGVVLVLVLGLLGARFLQRSSVQ